MMKHLKSLAAAILLALPAVAHAQHYTQPAQQQPTQQFNPFSGGWETTYPNSQLNFNPFNGQWQYTQPGVQPQFNPFNGQWEFPH